MKVATLMLTAAAALSLTAYVNGPAAAAGPTPTYSGQQASSVAGCPNLIWRLARDTNGSVHGILWYSDMSGLSEVTGTSDSGSFNLSTRSVTGVGPVGTIVGHRNASTGATQATMTGSGCANMKVDMKPIVGGGWGTGG
jgi:hypothetical protein